MEKEMDFTRSHIRGITLIELVTAIAITGILTSLAIPSFNHMRAGNAMAASLNLFLAQLHLARSTAVTRERHITLCPTADTTTCSDDPRDWADGYLIFEDRNRNAERDSNEEIVSHASQASGDIRISSSRYRNRISFQSQGRAWFSNATIRFCHNQYPDLNRKIIISNNGRVRKEKAPLQASMGCSTGNRQ